MPETGLVLHIDEAGMGCWAGPLGVAGVVCKDDFELEGLTDSKQLSETRREALFKQITQHQAITIFAIEEVAAEQINILGLAEARKQAIERIVDACIKTLDDKQITKIKIDGLGRITFSNIPTEYIIHGDSLVQGISAASILAKVTRDRSMEALETQYPGYGFANHVGYGTPEHQHALETLGPCEEHRIWYAPVAKYLERMLPASTEEQTQPQRIV